MKDLFVDQKIEGYTITEKIGEGFCGKVYKAYNNEFDEYRAIKFIARKDLRENWDNEIKKVIKIKSVSGVVRYISNGDITVDGSNYIYIVWDYIKSKSLKYYIENKELTIPIIEDILKATLKILHACQVQGISHSDLHSGNILIEDKNELNLNPESRQIYVTDFGYLSASMDVEKLDDFHGLNIIILDCINSIDFHQLNQEERNINKILKHEFSKFLLEDDVTQGEYVRKPKYLLEKYEQLKHQSKLSNNEQTKSIGDYLAAELIGDRYDEWKKLFVPKFLAIEELLGKNICVVTGLRGCGKTMIFRRLTAIFNIHLGDSGVQGADSFIGFYLNARIIAEAFPWLPKDKQNVARNQIIHFFHLAWCLEILEWLKLESENKDRKINSNWLINFFSNYYPIYFDTAESTINSLFHLRSWLRKELEKARLKDKYKSNWEITDYSFLEKFSQVISENCSWIGDRPFYFFFDDYSLPLVNKSTQRILNPIIFRRSSTCIFKMSTESAESFLPYTLNDKMLEERDDYRLIDFGTEAFLRNNKEIYEILSKILKPRIERHPLLAGRDLTLKTILGKNELNNTSLAIKIKEKKTGLYYGDYFFCRLWSSDIREMISIFADMVSRASEDQLKTSNQDIIDMKIQNTVLKEAGGKFIELLNAATNPSETSTTYKINNNKTYGERLVKIATSFNEIASFDLKHKTSKNQKDKPPKQARRIEISTSTSRSEMNEEIYDIYRGLIRYGIFIRDNRGKSARGKIVPRLYLRGLLIPYFNLTFSKRDSITFTWEDFCSFLLNPEDYIKSYKKKHDSKSSTNQPLLPGMDSEDE